MALTVETGQMVQGANSYADIATADSYHTDRGNADWSGASEAAKTAALITATAYLDGKYQTRLKGQRVRPVTQPLEWPRIGVRLVDTPQYFYGVSPSFYDSLYSGFVGIDVVPEGIIAATCELALRALSGPLAADIKPKDRLVHKKIDVIEYDYTAKDFTVCYQVVDQLMSRFLRSPSEAIRG